MTKTTDGLLKFIESVENYGTAFLSETTLLKDIKDERVITMLTSMYDSKDPAYNRLASIVNAIFTQQKCTFMISTRTVSTLIKEDPNSKYKAVDHKVYKAMLGKMFELDNGFVRRREPTNFKAGVYKMLWPDMVSIISNIKGMAYIDAEEIAMIKVYDNYDGKEEAKPKKVKSFADYVEEDRWEGKTVDVSNAVLTKEIIDETTEKIIKESGNEPRKIFD